MKTLWDFQKKAVEAFKNKSFFGLLFDCGLGKTMTAARIAEEKNRPVLIIAPSQLVNQWQEELNDKGEERITSKDWNVVACTSKNKNTKRFKEAFSALLEAVKEA